MRRQTNKGKVAVLAALAGLSLTAIARSAAAASEGPRAGRPSPLQQGLAFYRNKTVTFIAPTAVGSPNDIVSRAVAVAMGAYLHATVNVENIPSGQFIPGQDELAAADPNGLTIGYMILSTDYYDVLAGIPGVNFDPLRMVFLGGHPNSATGILLVSQKTSPYPSFAALLRTPRAAPLKILSITAAAGSEGQLLLKAFGIPFQFVYYENSSAEVAGFLRGDGQLMTTGEAEIQTEISSGVVRVLLVGSTGAQPRSENDYAFLRRVPTLGQMLKLHPPKTALERTSAKYFTALTSVPGYAVSAPSATPPAQVAALEAAVRYAFLEPSVKASITEVGNVAGYVPGRSQKIAYANALKLVGPISRAIRS